MRKKTVLDKLLTARAQLVICQPFFGVLALSQLELVEDKNIPTAGVDGRHMFYNPDFIDKLTLDELIGIYVHEVLHCAAGHPWRKDARDDHRWNVACDYAVNPIVKESKFILPGEQGRDYLFKAEWAGKAAEEIYNLLPEQPQQKSYILSGDVMAPGTSDEGPSSNEKAELEADWRMAVVQAAQVAKMRGEFPAHLERLAGTLARPKCDWKNLLARFVQSQAKDDYYWTRPNRRYLPYNLSLPSLHSETMKPIVVGIDTSGSIDDKQLEAFTSELNGILSQCRPERTYVLWADAEVASAQVFERDELIEFKPDGGGGTDFRPVFDYAKEHCEDAAAIVYITDMCGRFPDATDVDLPTLWVATTDQVGPFGETIRLDL